MKSLIFLSAALATAGGLGAAELPLAVDATHSRVEVVVKATVDSFVGKLEAYDAAIVLDPANGEVVAAKVAFHFADVKTGKSDRDEAMHEWQETPKHPDGVFTLTAIERDPATPGGRLARGTLVLHGRSKELVIPVSITHAGDDYAIDGDATLDTRDYGLPIIRKMMVLKVDPEVHVRFHLQGKLAGDALQAAPEATKKLN